MDLNSSPRVAIVDYGMGNLFSIKNACESVDLIPEITSEREGILKADAVILPGVGAFGYAMERLKTLNLIRTLKETADSTKPFMAICLGMQLLMSGSREFGDHEGLGIIDGNCFGIGAQQDKRFRIPHMGWNAIYEPTGGVKKNTWKGSSLDGIRNGAYMYFIHSYYVVPKNTDTILSYTRYGEVEFCSSLQVENLFACQYHPERSGKQGLKIYSGFFQRSLSQRRNNG